MFRPIRSRLTLVHLEGRQGKPCNTNHACRTRKRGAVPFTRSCPGHTLLNVTNRTTANVTMVATLKLAVIESVTRCVFEYLTDRFAFGTERKKQVSTNCLYYSFLLDHRKRLLHFVVTVLDSTHDETLTYASVLALPQ